MMRRSRLLIALMFAWPVLAAAPAPADAATPGGGATATGGTTVRLPAAMAADRNNVKSFGAVGDGTTNDYDALISVPSPRYLPKGDFYTARSVYSMPAGRWAGGSEGGHLSFREPGGVRQGARNLAVITHAPAMNTGFGIGGLATAFDGDFSNVHTVQATRIAGARTLGTPKTGYQMNPGTAMQYLYMVNQSGYNATRSGNGGRTGVAMIYGIAKNLGQGDQSVYSFAGMAGGTKPGATSYLANSAVSGLSGGFTAGANGVSLKPLGDFNMFDDGFDVTGNGLVINAHRTNGTGALGATWMMMRLQANRRSTAVDGMISLAGPTRIGIDLVPLMLQTPAVLPAKPAPTYAAITLAAGMRIFGDATNTDPTLFTRYTNVGTEWLSYERATGWNMVVGSTPILQASATGVATTQLRITTPAVPASATSACTKGQIAYDTGYVYVCIATNNWKRAALASW